MPLTQPSLSAFEGFVAAGERTAALSEAFDILHSVDCSHGLIDGISVDRGQSTGAEARYGQFAERFLTALHALILEPEFRFGPDEFEYFVLFRRWIDQLRLCAPQVLCPISALPDEGASRDTIQKFLLLAPPEALLSTHPDQIWRVNPTTAAFGFLAYLNSRALFTEQAYAFREKLLEWLPSRLEEVDLRIFSFGRLLEAYMLASYAATPRKHDIKAALIDQLARAAVLAGFSTSPQTQRGRGKPLLVVVNEWLSENHSMYRTHSRAIAALRERFYSVGFVMRSQFHAGLDGVFDECVAVPETDIFSTLRFIAAEITKRAPEAIFYPSIGMTLHGIAMAALRLAPIQIASYGHAASSKSPEIDYMILPEDFVGSLSSFSEKVLALPAAAMPFVPRSDLKASRVPPRVPRTDGVKIAVPASLIKLNPRLFEALAAIQSQATRPVEFQFFPAQMRGVAAVALRNALSGQLRAATVFEEMHFSAYMDGLRECDCFISPFPYGNTNGLVDAVYAGLPGVCLDGPEPHEHIDAGLFARLGFPPELITHSVEGYVAAALRLVNDPSWLSHCRALASRCDMQTALYDGDPAAFCNAVKFLVQTR